MTFEEWSNKKKKKQQEGVSSPSATTTKPSTVTNTKAETGGKVSFSDWSNKKKAGSSVKGWAQSAQNLLGEINKSYSSWNADEGVYTNFQSKASDLLAMADGWRKQYAGDEEAITSIDSVVDALSRAKSQVLKYRDLYSQFESESDYQTALRMYDYQKKYEGKSYEDILATIDQLEDGEEKDWLSSYKYEAVKSSPDYEDKSSTGWEKYLADMEAREAAERKEAASETFWEKLGRYLGDVQDTTLPVNTSQIVEDLRNDTSYLEPADSWSDEQKNIYGYLYETDKESAGAYAHGTTESINQAENQKKIAAIEDWATKNGFNGAVATLASIAMMPFSLVDTLSALTEYSARGFISTAETPLPGQISSAITGAISSTLNENVGTLNEKIPVIGGKGLGDAYQLGTSIANSMLTAHTQGVLGTYVTFFGSASASGMYDAKNRGATDEQAITFGILNGLAEAAGEAFSAEHLLSLGGVGELKSFFANILMQAGIEASEEGVTTLLNNFADQLVMGDKSNFNVLVTYYMAEEKLTEEEAKKKAWKSMANDLAFDMLGGFISGGVSSGIQTGIQSAVENKNAKDLYGADSSALVNEALEIDPNNAFAKKLQGKLNSGKTLSGGQINRLVQQNESAMVADDVASIREAAEKRLTALGETGDVYGISLALAKQAAGDKLTTSERSLIRESTYAQRVANELNTDNIRSGEYTTAWAEKIDTDRINAEEYSRLIADLEAEGAANVHETQNDERYSSAVAEKGAEIAQNAGEVSLANETKANVDNVTENATAKKTEKTGEIGAVESADKEAESTVTLEDASKKYGAQAGAMIHTYTEGQDVAKYAAAYEAAHNMGKEGVKASYAMESPLTAYLTESQRDIAYSTGVEAAKAASHTASAKSAKVTRVSTGEEVSVEEIDSIEDGEITLRLSGGDVVSASDVDFASDEVGLLYENVVDMKLDAKAANAFVQGYEAGGSVTAEEYASGFREAYRQGEYGLPAKELETNESTAKLTKAQRETAYNLGKADAEKKTAKRQKAVVGKKAKAKNAEGKVHYEINTSDMNEQQMYALFGLEELSKALGVDFHIFESEVGADGKRKGANGWFDPKDGSIHIDLYAGLDGKGTILFTAAHELTHFIREWSPAKFKTFADFLLEQYGKRGVSVEELVRRQIKKAKNNGRDIDFDTAYEEVIADSAEAMLADGDAIQKIAELKAKDKSLWQKIKDYIVSLADKIREVYKGLKPDSAEGRYVADMLDAAEQLKAMWTEALVDAGEAYSSASNTKGESEGEKQSVRDVTPISDADYKKAEKFFGTTTNYDVAGYLLVDGKMLDFSGKHWGDTTSTSRQVDHRDVWDAWENEDRNGTDEMINLIGNGNIRLNPESGGMNLAVMPNEAQIQALTGYIRHFKGEVMVDVDTIGGDTIHTFTYNKGTAPTAIIRDIKQYFENGTIPEAQADYRQFLYSDRDSKGNTLSKDQQEFFKDSAIKVIKGDGFPKISPDGKLLPVYHGTNTGEFYEFDKNLAGSSNDAGWFGKGFYFAFTKTEAEYYGGRVLECYLNIKKPFVFDEEMFSFEGETKGDVFFDFASFVLNMAEKFPDLAKRLTVDVAEHSDGDSSEVTEKTFVEIADEIYQIYKSNRLEITKVHDGDAVHYEYRMNNDLDNLDIPDDLKTVIRENGIDSASWAAYLKKDGTITRDQYDDILDAMDLYGEESFRTVYFYTKFKTKEMAEKFRLSTVIQYLSEKRYGYFEQHIPEYYMRQIAGEFSEELKRRGYDGILQSLCGDEVVAFEPEQIKLTTNRNPTSNPDIRYSDRDAAYMDAVESGDTETAQRMVDEAAKEAGYTELYYHGAKKGGGFTVFRDWSYFTESKQYAERYASRDKEGSFYTTYVKMEQPFDTRKAKDRKLFAEIRQEYGLGEIQDSGLPDWTDGYDISDYIDENELDYDGIILDEGGDLVDGKPVSRGLSYVVRKSAQIKSADPVTYDDLGNVIPISERFNTEEDDIRYSFRGTNDQDIEVYETSEEIKKLPYKERQKAFLDIMKNEYRGRTAKFIRNGHAYYALFDEEDINKNIYGDKRSDPKGWKAKINVGADGNIFELVENAVYDGSKAESGKHIAAHKGVGYWDYFIKTVQIDNAVFDLLANVRKKSEGEFVYSIQLKENKKIKASPPRGSLLRASSGVPNASADSIAQNSDSVKSEDVLYSDRVTDQETLDFLNNQEPLRVYRAMQVIDGELYPPMAAKVKSEDGKKSLVTPSKIGVWEQAVERPDLIRNGNKFELDKANGSSIQAAYNPYFHTSASPLNDQFSSAYKRPNLVIVEGEIPVSELTSGYRAQYAKDSVGETKWHSGPIASKLKGDKARRVFLSRWFKPVRIVPDAEVAAIIANTLKGESLEIPYKVVTPSLRSELENVGVPIKYSERDPELAAQQDKIARVLKAERDKLREDNQYLRELVRLQRQVTHGTKFTKSSVEAAAGVLMKYANAKGNKAELADLLHDFYGYIAGAENLSWEDIVEQARPVVEWLRYRTANRTEIDANARAVLQTIRDKRIYLDDQQQAEAAYVYGSYNEYRKKAMGSLTLVSKNNTQGAISLDSQWQEFAELYPEYFDADTNPNDMPLRLMEIVDTLRSTTSGTEYEYFDEMVAQDILSKVYDSYWDVSTLHTVADTMQREINELKAKHKRKMAEVREYHNEKHRQLRQEYRGKMDRMREEYRTRSEKKQRELKERYQESRRKSAEGRERTAMRHKIQKVVSDLNQYLLKGTKERHVPIELQKAVAEALSAVNMDTVGADQRIARLNEEMLRAKTPEAIQEISRKIDNIREMGDRMDGKLSALRDAYNKFVDSDDPLIANSHDEVISNTITKVMEYVGSTPLRDMSLPQLEAVHDMYRMMLATIRNANKAFKAAKSEEISTIANRVIEDMVGQKRDNLYRTKAGQALSEFDWNNLKPVYAFERIGSDAFTDVFNQVRVAEDTWALDMDEARAFREAQYAKHKYESWDFDERYSFTSSSGKEFELSLDQIMSLYAYSKRDQAGDHLKYGGFVFDGLTEVKEKTKAGVSITYRLKNATAYNLSEATLASIIGKLTPEQKAFVDTMQDYLSTTMGEKGNEVSLALYDVKLFKEKNYFPLKSAPQYLAKAREQAMGDVKIKNSGFTKETVPKARNPIVLTSFMDVWAGHVNEMSMYHAFTLALEDFYRVYNYKTPADEKMEPISMNASLENAHGDAAAKYIDQLLRDINGGARVDSTSGVINKLTGIFKKSAVFGSLSVVIQQPSAIARAAALVDTKYFVGGKISQGKHREVWAEVKKYAPVAIIKEMGYFDTGMGKGSVDWLKGDKTWRDKIDDVVSKAPALADEYAWCAIWDAVKRETLYTHKELRPNSEAFLDAVGERFTEVITKTQVYDSTLARSANMRSKDTGMKMATAFMAEPTTSLNMLENALIQGKRGNTRYARKTIGAVAASMILNSILVSFIYAGRDDDEDKTYTEKYLSTLVEELLDSFNPLTLMPFVKDIVSIAQGYDVERSDMAIVTDLINAWNNLESDSRSVYRKVEDFVGAIASFFGLPVKNLMRDARAIYNTVNAAINGEETTGAGVKNAIAEAVTGEKKSDGQQLYEAIIAGDTAQIERVKGRFKDQKAIDTALRKALRENDSRINEAAVAYLDGDFQTYKSLIMEIRAEGNFAFETIMAAFESKRNEVEKERGLTEESEYKADTDELDTLFDAGAYVTALTNGDRSGAEAIRSDMLGFMSESDLEERVKDEVKSRYEAGALTRSAAVSMLSAYGGLEDAEAESKVQYWEFKMDYPEYADLKESAVNKYYDGYYKDGELYGRSAESYGISLEIYALYNREKTGLSRKEDILYIIHALPLTSEQKDGLYYLNGWATSTIYEAPWR